MAGQVTSVPRQALTPRTAPGRCRRWCTSSRRCSWRPWCGARRCHPPPRRRPRCRPGSRGPAAAGGGATDAVHAGETHVASACIGERQPAATASARTGPSAALRAAAAVGWPTPGWCGGSDGRRGFGSASGRRQAKHTQNDVAASSVHQEGSFLHQDKLDRYAGPDRTTEFSAPSRYSRGKRARSGLPGSCRMLALRERGRAPGFRAALRDHRPEHVAAAPSRRRRSSRAVDAGPARAKSSCTWTRPPAWSPTGDRDPPRRQASACAATSRSRPRIRSSLDG